MTVRLVIPGPPTAKGRARFNSKTRRAYTDQKTKTAEGLVQQVWLAAGQPVIRGPLAMTVEAVVTRSKSHFRVNGDLSAAGLRQLHPVRKPDLDNLMKMVCDALNGLAYKDDVWIVESRLFRRWALPGEGEHTVVRMTALHEQQAAA